MRLSIFEIYRDLEENPSPSDVADTPHNNLLLNSYFENLTVGLGTDSQ